MHIIPFSKLLLCGAFLLAAPTHALEVIGVSDGDSLTVLRSGRPLKVRLANIDAPEKRQDFGERSKQSLSDMCYRKEASLQIQTIDRYGRAVALVTCGRTDVNRAQVRRGMAWVYSDYNKDKTLPVLEQKARARREGLWLTGDAMPPWEFRKQVRSAAKAKARTAW